MQIIKTKLANLTKLQKASAIVAVIIVLGFGAYVIFRNTQKPIGYDDQDHAQNEAKLIADAQSRDTQYQKDLQQWKAPKSSDELAKAQALVGKVGLGSDSRFHTPDECLSGLSRELYAEQVRTKRDDIPGFSGEEYKAKRAACYQNTL